MFTGMTALRSAAGVYTSGKWVPGAESTIDLVGSAQPATPNELLQLPEGDRTRATIAVWTNTALYTANEGTATPPDRIVWAGEQWEVQKVNQWDLGLAHCHVLATRVER